MTSLTTPSKNNMDETNYQTPTQPTNPVKQGDSGRLLKIEFKQRKG